MIELLSARAAENEGFWLKRIRKEAVSAIERLTPDKSLSDTGLEPESIIGQQEKPEISITGGAADIMQLGYDEWKRIYENAVIRHDEDFFTALSTAIFNAGTIISVPRGKMAEVNRKIVSKGASIIRTVIMLEEGSSLSFTDTAESAERNFFHSEAMEIIMKENSNLDLTFINSLNNNTVSVFNRKAVLGENSSISWSTLTSGSSICKTRRQTRLAGQGASVKDAEIMLSAGSQRFDVRADIIHEGRHTQSNVLAKGILAGESRQKAYGNVNIKDTAKGTNSVLEEHSIILSQGAKADSIPGLEIETNDVTAKHAATCTQLDEEKLFYITSRGVSPTEARKLVTRGFLASAIGKMSNKELLMEKAEKWLQHSAC